MDTKAMESVSMQTVVRLAVILLGFAILSGCAYSHSRWGASSLVVEESKMKFMIEPYYNISLNAIPGELVIKGTDNDYAEASMEVRCPDISGPCADHFAGLEFDTKREGNNLTIGTNKRALFSGNSAVKTTIALPRVEYLKVNMTAGNVDISGIDVNSLDVNVKAGNLGIIVNKVDALKVDVYAGDVNIAIPENIVAEVDLDAGVGDVSIQRQSRYEAAPRSFLIGAEVKKFISDVGATVKADVQFGNIKLNLTP